MKSFLAGTLAALLLLAATSCGKTEKEETTADAATDAAETTESTAETTAETTPYTPAELNYPNGKD